MRGQGSPTDRAVTFHAWRGDQLRAGTHLGTATTPAGLALVEPVGSRRAPGGPDGPRGEDRPVRRYAWAAWVGPEVRTAHPFTALVPSWNATTPGDSWLEVEARVSADGRRWSGWYSLGSWAETDSEISRTSHSGQDDEWAGVRVDELLARDGTAWTAFQLRLVLHRGPESVAVPTVTLLGAVTSDERPRADGVPAPATSGSSPVRGVELAVPAYSQQLHRGEHPQWDSGGASWCSPASTTMLLASWGLGPKEEEYAWVDAGCADRFVDFAACHVYDAGYGGAGNWSFNAAYAARYGAEAFVTRLRSLEEAERFIAAGIPLVASVSFHSDQLDGAGYDTSGHLLTIIGFDDEGDVVSHDPASHELPSNDEVRAVYDRTQFERVWIEGSGGLVYVVHPPEVPLPEPADPTQPNW